MTHKIMEIAKPNASLHFSSEMNKGKAISCHTRCKREADQVESRSIILELEEFGWTMAEWPSVIREREYESGATPLLPPLSFPSSTAGPILPSIPSLYPSLPGSPSYVPIDSIEALAYSFSLVLLSLSIVYTYPRAGQLSHQETIHYEELRRYQVSGFLTLLRLNSPRRPPISPNHEDR